MLTLEAITWSNFWQVVNLKLLDAQVGFLPSTAVFMAQAYVNLKNNDPDACFALVCGGEVIGFTKIVYMPQGEEPHFFAQNTYFIDALLVDCAHQGKGYGEAAFQKILAFIQTAPWGPVQSVKLCCYDANTAALKLYAKYGFRPTGQTAHGKDELKIYERY